MILWPAWLRLHLRINSLQPINYLVSINIFNTGSVHIYSLNCHVSFRYLASLRIVKTNSATTQSSVDSYLRTLAIKNAKQNPIAGSSRLPAPRKNFSASAKCIKACGPLHRRLANRSQNFVSQGFPFDIKITTGSSSWSDPFKCTNSF